MNESTRAVANLVADYARARKTRKREALFACGAELATIASLMTANVSQAVDAALIELSAEESRNLAQIGA